MPFTKITATLAAVAATAALTACSGSTKSADFNDADVTFSQEMIPHHRQATEMAALASSRTDNEQILTLASDIAAAQGPEIKTMTSWLTSWGEDVPGTDDDSMGDMAGMAGMMSSADMSELADARGAAFDRMFLSMMIEHHTGAITMAAAEEREGKYVHATDLAERIQQEQAAEIAQMNTWLAQ